jgi:WD40 repeat protein
LVAVENEQEATTQRNLAQQNEARAVRNEQMATENAEEARRQEQIANQNADEAYKNRLLSIAQAMSVKSLQVDQDLDLKSLLAYQAYKFNQEYGGLAHNADIYLGLYNALKMKNKESYIEFNGHDDNVNSIQFVPGSSEFYSVDSEGRLLHFDLNNPDRKFPALSDSGTVVKDLAISSDGKWLACATWTGIRLYDLKSRSTPMKRLTGHRGEVLSVNFLPGTNQLITSGSDRKLLLWDITAETNTAISNQQTTIQDLAVSSDGQMIAAATKEGKLLLWNHWTRSTDEPIIIYQEARNQVSAVCFSKDGSVLVSGDQQGNVKIWYIERRE